MLHPQASRRTAIAAATESQGQNKESGHACPPGDVRRKPERQAHLFRFPSSGRTHGSASLSVPAATARHFHSCTAFTAKNSGGGEHSRKGAGGLGDGGPIQCRRRAVECELPLTRHRSSGIQPPCGTEGAEYGTQRRRCAATRKNVSPALVRVPEGIGECIAAKHDFENRSTTGDRAGRAIRHHFVIGACLCVCCGSGCDRVGCRYRAQIPLEN